MGKLDELNFLMCFFMTKVSQYYDKERKRIEAFNFIFQALHQNT